nr:hypothetical protein [Tanacetum cinerariifolium]
MEPKNVKEAMIDPAWIDSMQENLLQFKRLDQQPSEGELDLLFEAMYDDYIDGQPSATARTVPPAQEPQVYQTSTASTTIADIAPTPINSSSLATNIPISS